MRRRWAIGSFFSTAWTNRRAVSLRGYKKASVQEEKIVFPYKCLWRSTCEISKANKFIKNIYDIFKEELSILFGQNNVIKNHIFY